MLKRLLPHYVASAEMYGDDSGDIAQLYPEEAAAVAGSVENRRREFAAVRICARSAMMTLGAFAECRMMWACLERRRQVGAGCS
jgi:putative phosphopantetheinyl transferase